MGECILGTDCPYCKNERLTAENEQLREALRYVDRWLAAFIAAWDQSRDKKKPSEAPVALMGAIRQHSVIRKALADTAQESDDE